MNNYYYSVEYEVSPLGTVHRCAYHIDAANTPEELRRSLQEHNPGWQNIKVEMKMKGPGPDDAGKPGPAGEVGK